MSRNLSELIEELNVDSMPMGDLKKIAREIKVNHELALELWASKLYYPQLLAVLIFDKKLLDQTLIETLVQDIESYDEVKQNQISEWLLANQLTKSKKTKDLLLSWEDHELVILRRLFWYYQARLRWSGQLKETNTEELLQAIEKGLANEEPQVQWTMNFCAAWIGIYDKSYRKRCIKLGESLGLYKEQKVPRNCTPNYLPEFIRIEVEKRQKNK